MNPMKPTFQSGWGKWGKNNTQTQTHHTICREHGE